MAQDLLARRLAALRRLTALAAGLAALLLAAGCASESMSERDLAAPAAPSPDSASSAALRPAPRPAPAARPVPAEHPYAALWRAAASGALASGGFDPTPSSSSVQGGVTVERRAQGKAAPAAPDESRSDYAPGTPTDPASAGMGNAPERSAATGEESSDEALPGRTAHSGQLRMEDYAQLSRYLEGIASWYGPNFHGKPTANGETYNQYGLTAAHPVLPIGTRVLVENLSNGRKVWLRINDRGPYAKGRVLDLSRLAAERLGIIAQGTAPVRITVLKWPHTVEPALGLKAFQQYTVQTAAYPELSSAEELRERLQAQHPGFPFFVDRASNGFYAVAAGPFDDEREARQVAHSIHRSGFSPIVKRYRN